MKKFKCTDMKTKIKKTANKNEDFLLFNNAYDLGSEHNAFIHPSSISRIGWIENENLLELLRSLLYSYGLIDCNNQDFNLHFWGSHNGNINFIKWYGEITQLVYLFDLLIIYRCIPSHTNKRHKILSEHFCNSTGNIYNLKTLSVTLNQIRNESPGIIDINEIFQKMIKGGLKPVNHQA